MEINLAKSAGFCFGVKRARTIALKIAQRNNNVCMLGDIVHNELVVKEIERAGIKKITKLANGKNKILLIRAHGTGRDIFKKALGLGYQIIDATCPMVKEIHKIAKDAECKGYKVIVIGDRNHDEVRGIIGQLKQKAVVIDRAERIPLRDIKMIKKACVVVQSTQNLEIVDKIVEKLKPYIPQLQFFNTICRPTRIKQEEIKRLPLENDVMIVIGSRTSANTKRLFEISKSLNPRSFWVNSKQEINPGWFKGAQRVGLTAGASTPESSIKEIFQHISQITKKT